MIVLVGFMGAGKSTVGRLLAARLGVPFHDSDDVVEAREGRVIRDIFASDGEPEFRRVERESVASLLVGPDAVLALGGGAVEDAATRAALSRHVVVYLETSLDEVRARVGGDEERPVLSAPGLEERYLSRLPLYREVADVVVPTAGRDPEDLADDLAACL